MKRISIHSLGLIIALFMLGGLNANAQLTLVSRTAHRMTEPKEEIMAQWRSSAANLKKTLGLSNVDFRAFVTFYGPRIDSEKLVFMKKVVNEEVTDENVIPYLTVVESRYIYLYNNRYKSIKEEFPSSVAEYAHSAKKPLGICNPGCNNIDFSNGTLSGWNAYYAENTSTSTSFLVKGITGGLCGPGVVAAANDPKTNLSSAPTDYQVEIMTGGNDPLVPAIPRVSPFGGSYSARIGDSTNPYQGVAILNQTFLVTAANVNFTYQYAVFLENPTGHTYYQQPFFNVALLDSVGDTIPHCGEYNVVASAAKGFGSVYYSPDVDSVKYRNWTVVFASLKKYIGHCVTIQFECADCALGGHFGYAYVSASCAPLGLITSSPAFCGQKTINLTGPPGGTQYQWTGPTNGIVGQDTAQTITIDSAGTYKLIVTPVTGALCADTMTITVPKAPGPPPIPSFKADTVCAGTITSFNNTSTPAAGPGIKFYWNFNGLGTYQDSTTNPTYNFSKPGVYPVTLWEVNNGCGADTTIKIKVDSNAVASFTATGTCVGGVVSFTNNSTGGVSYSWNFGDGGTSTAFDPTYTYSVAGTYTVTLVAKSTGACSDTIREPVTIVPPPKVIVTGLDSICPGNSTTLTASGATTYTWLPGSLTGASILVAPFATTTYTVTGTNGSCSHDTTYVVKVLPVPRPTVVAKPDSICVGGSSTLVASGGTTYLWSTGATGDSIKVTPALTETYTVTASNGSCTGTATASVFVIGGVPPALSQSRDSICPSDTVTLRAYNGVTYVWSTGATSTSIVMSPTATGTYYVIAKSKCFDDTIRGTIHVVPLPVPVITASSDSICANTNDVLTASGGTAGTTYLWSTGSTNSNIVVHPGTQTTYTVTESNGSCSASTTDVIKIKPSPTVTLTGTTSVCQNDTITLTATGGGTYEWSNGMTGNSISFPATTAGINNFYVIVTKGCADTTFTTVTVNPVTPVVACCDTTINLGGTAVIGATGATAYVWEPSGNVNCYTCPNTTATPTVNTTYTVVGTDANGCKSSATVTVDIACHDFDVPNVFTPNPSVSFPDNVFYIQGAIGQPNYELEIYDRWGVLVFKTTITTDYWDGTNKGHECPDGVYYYIINATCEKNKYQKKGFVQIIRK